MQYQHVVYGVTPGGLPVSGGSMSRAFGPGSPPPVHVKSERLDVDDDADDSIDHDFSNDTADDEISEGPSGADECPVCGNADDDTDDGGG